MMVTCKQTKYKVNDTFGHAGHYKQIVQGPSIDTHCTPALTPQLPNLSSWASEKKERK